MNQLKFLVVFIFLSGSFNFCLLNNGFVLGSAGSHAEIVGGARSVAMSSAELADGLLADDYDAIEEEWEDPASTFKAGRKKQKQKTTTTTSELDKDSVFQQGMFTTGAYGETRDFLHFLRRIKYDHRQCPDDGGAVTIDVSIVVSNIRAVSEVTMDYALEMFYREAWTDKRLNYDKSMFRNKTEISLHESYTNMIWHPDTFMPNAIASKNPQKQSISHRSLLRLQEHGRILYSRRISVVAECPMDLVLFPFDTQICKLGIESYGYTADQVVYQWSRGQISALVLSKIRLPDFQVKESYVVSQIESYATGDYSRLYVCFVFTRASGFCFLQLIIPSTAVVITSWVTLWLEKETEFQDMISIILAITFLIFSYNEMMPRVSYLKALDIWLAVCFLIVFMSLIKLALVKYMRQKLNSQRYREASMVANILPIIRTNSVSGVAPAENGSLSPGNFTFVDQEANNNGNSIQTPNNTTTVTRPFRSCSIQYTSVPLGPPELYPESKEHGVDLFAKCSSGLSRFLPSCRFTSQTMRRFHWITQMAFFFGFTIFAMLYFLLYPNVHFTPIDPACDRDKAEFFAIIS